MKEVVKVVIKKRRRMVNVTVKRMVVRILEMETAIYKIVTIKAKQLHLYYSKETVVFTLEK